MSQTVFCLDLTQSRKLRTCRGLPSSTWSSNFVGWVDATVAGCGAPPSPLGPQRETVPVTVHQQATSGTIEVVAPLSVRAKEGSRAGHTKVRVGRNGIGERYQGVLILPGANEGVGHLFTVWILYIHVLRRCAREQRCVAARGETHTRCIDQMDAPIRDETAAVIIESAPVPLAGLHRAHAFHFVVDRFQTPEAAPSERCSFHVLLYQPGQELLQRPRRRCTRSTARCWWICRDTHHPSITSACARAHRALTCTVKCRTIDT